MSDFINTIDQLGDDVVINSIIDGSITEFRDNVLEDCKSLAGCTALETLEIPNLKYIRNEFCRNLGNLKHIYFPNAMLGNETNPGMAAFQNCTALTSVYLPNLQEIPNYFFFGVSLTFFELLNANKINAYGFYNSKLETLILRKSDEICVLNGANAFDGTPIKKGTGYIYVPKALIDTYKTATNWSVLANQFRALEDYTVDGTITGELDESKI